MITVGVIGKNEQHPNDVVGAKTMEAAEVVGRLVAQRGGVVVTGGRRGVMEAASKGAKEAGGLTIAFLPSMDRSDANPYCDIVFPTGLGRARNLLTARSCQVLVVIGGSGGWSDRILPMLHEGRYLDERCTVEISRARTPEEATDMAFRLAERHAGAVTTDRP